MVSEEYAKERKWGLQWDDSRLYETDDCGKDTELHETDDLI